MKKLLFIVGPTASGKSDFAVQVAKLLKTDVISSDSMQIYKDMTVGTAKITPEEQQGVTHHLIDFVNPKDSFSVAEYREKALPVIDELLKNDKTPIISSADRAMSFQMALQTGSEKLEALAFSLTKFMDGIRK